jgi:terminase, large subunit
MQQTTITETLRRFPLPSWMPPRMRSALAGRRVEMELPRPIKQRLRQPQKVRVSEWAEKHRMVADGAHIGSWHHEYAPHTVKIMDTFGLPWVREIWFCGVEQSGKTNTMLNCMAWATDCDPGDMFYLMPTEGTAEKVMGEKIQPTFRKSPRLSRYLGRKQDATTLSKISMQHGMKIIPAWSNSPSSMATFTAKYCFGDEVDKYPVMSGKEADPITLIGKRNRNFKGRYKRFFSSTPAGLYIYKGMQACHQVWEFRVKCPDCGEYVKMDAEHLDLAPDATAESVEQAGVEYSCNACGGIWNETTREHAVKSGRWVCVKGADIQRPAKVGFHHRAWECLDVTLVEIAAAYLKSKAGEHADKVAWSNGYEAVDYAEEKMEREHDAILALCDDRPEGLVPSAPIAAISCVADMQKRGFWYTVRAWGYGLEQESWLLKCGFVDSWSALEKIFFQSEYKDVHGTRYVPTLWGVDSGGGESEEYADFSRTAEAYLFACKYPQVILFKGNSRMTQLKSVTRPDRIPGTNKPLPGSPMLYNLNSNIYKDRLASKLLVQPVDPGAWHLHSGRSLEEVNAADKLGPIPDGKHPLQGFAKQMCAEYREGHKWLCAKNKANHYWDCAYYELALVDIAEIKNMRQPDLSATQAGRRVRGQGVQA